MLLGEFNIGSWFTLFMYYIGFYYGQLVVLMGFTMGS